MASKPLRAVHRAGVLRLLEPVNLTEGEEIWIAILSHDDRARAALGDLLAELEPISADEAIEVEEIMRSLAELPPMQPPLSETIVEERRNGP